jgi:hypothetical protein
MKRGLAISLVRGNDRALHQNPRMGFVGIRTQALDRPEITPPRPAPHAYLAAAHLDGDPTNNRLKNLHALCQHCHMLNDRPHHLAQGWIT